MPARRRRKGVGRRWSRAVLGRRRKGRRAFKCRPAVLVARVPHLWLGPVFIRSKWSLAVPITLPVAPPAAAAAPSTTPSSVARLAIACSRAFCRRLRLVEIAVLGRVRFVIFMRDRLLRGSVLRDLMRAVARFAAAPTTATTAATPAPPRPIAIASLAALLAFGFGCRDFGIFGRFAFRYGLILLEVFDR